MIKSVHIVLGLLTLISSCKQSSNIDIKIPTIRIDKTLFLEKPTVSTIAINFKAVALETSAASFVSEVNKIVENGGDYFLEDTYTASGIFKFDSTGRFLTNYGSKGHQKNQYVLPLDFCIDSSTNELMVLNSEVHRINYYDLHTSEFKRSKSYAFPVRRFAKLGKDCIAFLGASRDSRIIFSNTDLERDESFLNYEERFAVGLLSPFTVTEKGVLMRLSYNDTLYRVECNKISPFLIIDFMGHRFTKEAYDSLNSPQKRRLSDYTTDKMTNLITYNETTDHRVFSFNYQKDIYMCVQDKHSLHTKVFNSNDLEDDVFYLRKFPTIVGTDSKQNFLCLLSSTAVLNAKKLSATNQQDTSSVFASLSTITELSNPTLVKFKFQKF